MADTVTPAWRGRDLYEAEQYVEAEIQLRLAVSLDPKNAEAWYNLGLVLYALTKLDEATDAFKNVAFLNPYRADVYIATGIILKAKERPLKLSRHFNGHYGSSRTIPMLTTN